MKRRELLSSFAGAGLMSAPGPLAAAQPIIGGSAPGIAPMIVQSDVFALSGV